MTSWTSLSFTINTMNCGITGVVHHSFRITALNNRLGDLENIFYVGNNTGAEKCQFRTIWRNYYQLSASIYRWLSTIYSYLLHTECIQYTSVLQTNQQIQYYLCRMPQNTWHCFIYCMRNSTQCRAWLLLLFLVKLFVNITWILLPSSSLILLISTTFIAWLYFL